ncbi:hypothetical protein ACRE_066050 [Hapsidospora chrysogenum ATCC 11550]|uniref:DUF7053 domain-containing protein n=1 Tax=Hapsidospora chrysogenum (strain ATCC 11550 / CBS 779.69 / DSM 880 / IAM 14645 / JCM 23072 / IMI 49137) TaxID=857340 RepID=A0A086SZX6_HAPC1|nr:hypothetical protein ACRE_066050 [Hapsidospora chrysogenum ATCC 11550]
MRVQRHLSIAVPIPPSLPPSVVIAVLQTVSPVIRNLGTLSRYEETAAGGDPVASDPFFHTPPGSGPVTSYQIFELITLAPGLTKEVTYPAYFQRVGDGVRCRANGAAGITGWCEFIVRPRQVADSPEGSASTPSTVADGGGGIGAGPEEYELHESIVVEANSLLMPFVCHTMGVAHRGLCDKVLQEAADKFSETQGWDYRHLGQG